MKTREIKTKRPWKRIRPVGYLSHGRMTSMEDTTMPDDNIAYEIITQADFLREFYPSGHIINDPLIYPDIYREEIIPVTDSNGQPTEKNTRRIYKESVPRYAFAFQQIIAIKQIVHLCGNDIQFDLNKSRISPQITQDFADFREGWLGRDMEIAFYEAVKSTKITGDAAVVGYMENGEFRYKALSFLKGDVLYPHYGNRGMELFARAYKDYDEEGGIVTEWLEVWDRTNFYRYKKTGDKYAGIVSRILRKFNLSGYTLVDQYIHGFPFIPVAYHRDEDGACWSPSQDSCDAYDLSFSQMAHNNQEYGEPILVLQSEGESDILHDMNGTIKMLSMQPDDKASYLEAQSASESYMKQLDTLYKMIYEQSFTVIPPELKSGDLPAAALKILYSPAYEKATMDAAEYQPFLNDLVRIFSHGYGMERGKTIGFATLPIKWWIKPYVHINWSTTISDIATAVQNRFLSRQTASERISEYSTVCEWDRLIREEKEEQQNNLLLELQKQKTEQQNTSDDTTD